MSSLVHFPFGYAVMHRHPRLLRVALWTGLALTFGAMLMLSWRRWSDPQIDFGTQLYLPWRVLEGEHIGRDYVHPYGPWSTYFHAALFKAFGPSVVSVVVTNLALYGVILTLLFGLMRRAFGAVPAWTAVVMSVPTFGFAHLTGINNYNYVTPYAHEATHGMVFLLFLLHWVFGSAGRPAVRDGMVTGVVFGLICLTKIEIVVAGAGVIAFATMRRKLIGAEGTRAWATTAVGTAVAVLVLAWGVLAAVVGARPALVAVSGGFLSPVLYPDYTVSGNTLRFLGLDHPFDNLHSLVVASAAAGAVLVCLGVLARFLDRRPKATVALAIPLGVTLAALLIVPYSNRYAWCEPVLLLIGTVILGRRLTRRAAADAGIPERFWQQSLLLAAAALLMIRMVLAPKVEHYGFYQLMLSTLWICGFYASEWPRAGGYGRSGAALIAAFILGWNLLFGAVAAKVSHMFYAARTQPIGTGRDYVLGYGANYASKHQVFEATRVFLAARVRPNSSVLVLPEGIFLNYLLRVRHPLHITNALAPTLALRVRELTDELQAKPPDFVVIMTRQPSDDVYPLFGQDTQSGKAILNWLHREYTAIGSAGADPLSDFRPDAFGVLILQKKSVPAP